MIFNQSVGRLRAPLTAPKHERPTQLFLILSIDRLSANTFYDLETGNIAHLPWVTPRSILTMNHSTSSCILNFQDSTTFI